MTDETSPTNESPLPLSYLKKIDRLCNEFEEHWQRSNRPLIEDYLQKVAPACRSALLTSLVASEVEKRHAVGEECGIDEYHQRFPTEYAAVETAWAIIANRQSKEGSLSSTFDALRDVMAKTGDNPQDPEHAEEDEQPETDRSHYGRYEVKRVVGEGGFGRVYLAFDPQLRRSVALKVPRGKWLSSRKRVDALLHEARSAASLKHPALVAVHDVQQDGDDIYIVQEYVEGPDLRCWARSNRPNDEQVVRLIMEVLDAIGFAHQHDLVHRDLKPGNLLIDRQGHPHVTDFGLALSEDVQRLRKGDISGTPQYMSPEQVRGETHLLDGRSDLWSIGVILYELLTRCRPFGGADYLEIFEEVKRRDPKPLRMINPKIPAELERICLKCLAKRRTDRYSSAAALREDLQVWLDQQTSHRAAEMPAAGTPATSASNVQPASSTASVKDTEPKTPPRIVPKGLRSYDAHDADFFLELLPGPRARNGLPESIRFWKSRIEEIDPDSTFKVGLIYGPSGCGKSSLMKAGLLPRLGSYVRAVYVEATHEDTELRLAKGLRRLVDHVPDETGLPELLAGFREGIWLAGDQKTLIILDQFEQWLHARRGEQDTQLVQALRHCDGQLLQCIVMVRDDFWLAASRFMKDLEVPLVEGKNSLLVDLFEPPHARQVLAEFGRAFNCLPEDLSDLSSVEETFLDEAVKGLAQDGKVISVRLTLFAEMMKGKPWTIASLQTVGGPEGVGVTFLEETFSAKTAPPEHRLHQKTARAVLKSLLPESGANIKGSMRSYDELLDKSTYAPRAKDFDDLLRILDTEIRLISPTDPEGVDADDDSNSDMVPGKRYYQLTHDYLVPSLREWLTRKQKETRKGRAELRLAERSAQWNAKPENRHLPSFWEWGSIRSLTSKKKWSHPERTMMTKTARRHGARVTALVLLVAALSFVGLRIRNRVVETNNDERATGLVTALIKANIEQVPGILDELRDYRQWADPKLREQLPQFDETSTERLNISLGLLPGDPTQLGYLEERLLNAKPDQVETICSLLTDHEADIIASLWGVAQKSEAGEETQLLQAASALAAYDAENGLRWSTIADRVVDALVAENSLRAATWIKTLQPARRHLLKPLGAVYRDKSGDRSQTQIELATGTLEAYAADDVETLYDLLLDGKPEQFAALFDEFTAHGEQGFSKMATELDREPKFTWNDPPLDPAWTEPTANVADKIQRADGMITRRFAFCQTISLDQFESVAEQLGKSGFRPTRLRPYACESSVQVAAAWARDGRKWRLATGKTADELRQQDESYQGEGFVAVDVTGYVGQKDGQAAELYSALWVKKRDNSAAKSKMFATRAEALIKRAIANGLNNYLQLQEEADFDPIRKTKVFTELMKAGNLDVRYSAVLNTSDRFESLHCHSLSPTDHLAKCQTMQSQGYRPVSLSAASIGGKTVSASVWHRPRIPDTDRDRLMKRQANAAIALLRHGYSEPVREMMEQARQDPEALTQFVHRSRGSEVTVIQLLDALDKAVESRQATRGEARKSKDHVLYGILLSLGEFGLLEIPETQRQSFTERKPKTLR